MTPGVHHPLQAAVLLRAAGERLQHTETRNTLNHTVPRPRKEGPPAAQAWLSPEQHPQRLPTGGLFPSPLGDVRARSAQQHPVLPLQPQACVGAAVSLQLLLCVSCRVRTPMCCFSPLLLTLQRLLTPDKQKGTPVKSQKGPLL